MMKKNKGKGMEMNEFFEFIILLLAGIPVGLFLGACFIYVFNNMPAIWLCDYGEIPSEELRSKDVQRIKGFPNRIILQTFFIALWMAALINPFHQRLYVFPFIVCVWLLMIIAISDYKYMIIPDQFVIFLLLMAGSFVPFGHSARLVITGAFTGAGIMLIVALAGYIISGRESLGFGDVKLMAAIGALSGLRGCIVIMVMASLTSGIWFSIALFRKKVKPGEMKPLGPFLCGAAILYLLCI